MRNNKGMSLVEIVIVIALMAVLLGIAVISLGNNGTFKLKDIIENVEGGLAKTRTYAISKGDATFKIENKDGVYYLYAADTEKIQLGDKKVRISYTSKADGADVPTKNDLVVGDSLELTFNRSTGAFEPLSGSSDVYCYSIILERDGKVKTIKLVPKTGKFYIEN